MAVAADGSLLVITADSVVALDPNDGHQTFSVSFARHDPTRSALFTIDPENTIYLASFGTPELMAIDLARRATRWTFTANCKLSATPVVGDAGTIYTGCIGETVALDPCSGRRKWKHTDATASAFGGGLLYADDFSSLSALAPSDGHMVWTTDGAPAAAQSSIDPIVIAPDGTLYRQRASSVSDSHSKQLHSNPSVRATVVVSIVRRPITCS